MEGGIERFTVLGYESEEVILTASEAEENMKPIKLPPMVWKMLNPATFRERMMAMGVHDMELIQGIFGFMAVHAIHAAVMESLGLRTTLTIGIMPVLVKGRLYNLAAARLIGIPVGVYMGKVPVLIVEPSPHIARGDIENMMLSYTRVISVATVRFFKKIAGYLMEIVDRIRSELHKGHVPDLFTLVQSYLPITEELAAASATEESGTVRAEEARAEEAGEAAEKSGEVEEVPL